MFDFLEEELLEEDSKKGKKVNEAKKEFTLPADSAIFAMPEKFRKRSSASASFNPLILIALLVIVVIGTIGGVLFLVLGQSKDSRITLLGSKQQKKPGQDTTSTKDQPKETTTIPDSLLSQVATSTQVIIEQSPVASVSPTVAPSLQVSPSPSGVPQLVMLSQAADVDNDELTDKEEELWRTDPQKPDTDDDGFLDGPELLNLYDPTKGDRARLVDSSVALNYKNQTYRYSFLYPSKMIASPSNNSEREVILSSSTGELFSVMVQDNPQRLVPLDWYKTQVSKNGSVDGVAPLSYNGWTGVMGPDNRTVFLTPADNTKQIQSPILVVISYNPNTQTQLHFIRTFQLVLRSFNFF